MRLSETILKTQQGESILTEYYSVYVNRDGEAVRTLEPTAKPCTLKRYPDLKMFLVGTPGAYTVHDWETGMNVLGLSRRTHREALEVTENRISDNGLERFDQLKRDFIARHGRAPHCD
jgi:hypothetical protein